MIATSNFHVLVHKDSGDPKIEDGYVKEAECSFIGRKWSLPEEDTFVPFIFGYRPSNQPCHLKLNCDFGLLTLECTEFPSSKSVQLNFEWQNPNRNASTNDYYICGSLTVTPNIDTGVASVLLKTPPNEAVKVTSDEHGRFIPLLKSVVAVPFSSSFTVNAQLQYSDNANSAFSPIVENGAATFPVVDDDQDALAAPEFSFGFKILTLPFYKSTKYIAGIDGGLLKVTAHEPGLQNNTNIDHESEDSSEIDENNSGRNGALSIPLAAFDFVARLATGIFSRGRKHLDPFPLGSRGENELQSQTSMNFSEKRASNDDSSSQKSNANDNNIAQNDHGERAELVAAEATKLDMAICNSRSTEQEIPACYEDDACGFKHFDITRDPAGHHFLGANGQKSDERNWLKKVQQDWSILQNNLPDGIHVRV